MKGRTRRLSPHEIEVWTAVTRSVRRLRPDAAVAPELEAPPPVPQPAPTPKAPASPRSSAAEKKPAPVSRPPPLAPIEPTVRRRLRRDHAPPELVLDLHGMTQHQAHGQLKATLTRAQHAGVGVVLVITGKGKLAGHIDGAYSEREPGVLRRVVPHWLGDPDLRHVVMGFEQAGPRHGGSGAIYVRVRRLRPHRDASGALS